MDLTSIIYILTALPIIIECYGLDLMNINVLELIKSSALMKLNVLEFLKYMKITVYLGSERNRGVVIVSERGFFFMLTC